MCVYPAFFYRVHVTIYIYIYISRKLPDMTRVKSGNLREQAHKKKQAARFDARQIWQSAFPPALARASCQI